MKNKIFEMVMFATFASIILLMALVPNLGYLTFIPGISITIIHIPVLIGIMLLSFWYALGLGLVFGLSSLIASYMYASSPGDIAFQNPLVSVIPRILFAVVAFGIIIALKKIQTKEKGTIINFIIVSLITVGFIVAGAISLNASTNWPLYLIVILAVLSTATLIVGYAFFLFKSKHKHLAYVPSSMILSTLVHSFLVLSMIAVVRPDAFGDGNIFYTILTIIAFNSVIEALTAVVIGSPIVFALNNLRGYEYVTV
ncbi:MAG: hypothetical protein GX931_05240 [Acholeplasmataceae bacterium]|jgi:uncharacterized membrane protein|nr:hypothetical protein [Acholeplasmataceae bacterium]